MSKEDVLKSEKIYRGRLLTLLRYEASIEGRRVLREVVEHPGAVAIVPIKDDGKIVFVRQHRLPAWKRLVEIPAGTRMEGEDEEDCARRELTEETGYKACFLKNIRSFYVAPGYSTEKITLFIAKGLEKVGQSLEEDESIEIFEASLEEAMEMLRKGLIEDAKTIIGIYELASIGF